MKNRILFFGVGSPYSLDLEACCQRLSWDIVAYVANIEGEVFVSSPDRVIQPIDLTDNLMQLDCVVPLLTPAHRKSIRQQLDKLGMVSRPPLLDPTTPIANTAAIDQGVTVNAGGSIGAAARLGEFCAVNRSTTIGHHSVLEQYVTLGPGVVLAGSVHIGKGAFIGAGAVLLPKIRVGSNAIVGAGAVVTKDVPDNCIVVGNPAKLVKSGIAGYNGAGV